MSQFKSVHVARLENRVARTTARIIDAATRQQVPVADLAGLRLPWFAIRNCAGPAGADSEPGAGPADDVATILLFDEIGGSLGVHASEFVEELDAITAPTIHLRINSPGGSLFDAIAMYNALHHHPSRIIVFVDALAASAASVVAMGGDEIVMMPGSQMMIHDASAVEDGNSADHAQMATFLDRQSGNVADIYRLRAGGEATAWRELMLAETWMFADEAVQLRLADRMHEVPRAPTPTGDDELMSRSFDLSGFRYRGRVAAPAPGRASSLPAIARTKLTERSAPQAAAAESAAAVAEAGRKRAAAVAAGTLTAGTPPTGQARTVSTEWMRRAASRPGQGGGLAGLMPPRLSKPTKVERNGKLSYLLEGYFTVYERGYEMLDEFGPYTEVVAAGAGARSIAAGPDTIFLVNHAGLAMARTTAGTLELSEDTVGGRNRMWLNPERQDVKNLVAGIDDENVTEQSFSFWIVSGRWSPDMTVYRIADYEIDRGDTSAVNYGANPYTSIAARAQEILDQLERMPEPIARAALDRLARRAVPTAPAQPAATVRTPALTNPSSGRLLEIEAWLATVEAART